MQVTLTKTLENAARFANWCREYHCAPRKVAELIQLYKEYNSCKGWEQRQKYNKEISERLTLLGFEDISFYNSEDRLRFTHPNGDTQLHLPEV